jgi:hypothetical protein
MSKQQRIEKDQRRLALMEEEYAAILLPALQSCAGGFWGLFDQGNYAESPNPMLRRLVPPEKAVLLQRGDEIESLRAQLVMEPFQLHQRFLAYCGMYGPNTPGEPKLAQAFLAELAEKSGEEAAT